ncbi:hypothetical protein C7S13_7293 [Burkholderia cepacia]|nr:hypothetical protein [Burkholderia cepacia]
MPQRVESNDSNPVPHCRCVIAHRCPEGGIAKRFEILQTHYVP